MQPEVSRRVSAHVSLTDVAAGAPAGSNSRDSAHKQLRGRRASKRQQRPARRRRCCSGLLILTFLMPPGSRWSRS